MSENQSNNNQSRPPGGPKRPHNHRRRHHNNNNRPRDNAAQGANSNQGQQQASNNSGQSQNNRRRHHHHNRPHQNRPHREAQSLSGGGFNIERIYEKYLNLLEQHLIARRKYHDLFFRADPAQKIKLEKNFYNTIADVREFENKLAPDVRALFEKRNNGYSLDHTYTSNHGISVDGDAVPADLPPAEPHFLQSQIAADYSNDTEESVGSIDDYLSYKNN